MKALVIGLGKMGLLHAATLKSLSGIEEVRVVEPSTFVRRGLQDLSSQTKVFADLKDAIDASIGLAVVTTPSHLHASMLETLLERNIHTFVEKPLTTSYAEAKRLQDIQNRSSSNAKVMIGYCLRFVPTFEWARHHLQEGLIGAVESFTGEMYSSDVLRRERGWRLDQKHQGGGVLLDLGCHLVDLIRSMFGLPRRILGVTQRVFSKAVEDSFEAELDYGNNQGKIHASWSQTGIRKPQAQISVQGSHGQLRVTDDGIEFELLRDHEAWKSGKHQISITDLAKPVPFDLAGPFYTFQWLEFLNAIRSGGQHRNGIPESVDNHHLIDLIRESKGQWKSLNPKSS